MANLPEDSARAAPFMDWAQLSPDSVSKLGVYDFMAYLGKRVLNPGGRAGREQVLDRIQPRPNLHILEIGGGFGQTACQIAQKYRCKVTSIDISPRAVSDAQGLVKQLGLGDWVRCEVGDVNDLRFRDTTFDAVVCQAVLTFLSHQQALSEVRRVLKDQGVFVGLECCWRQLPPAAVREATSKVCSCETLNFHSMEGWVGALRDANFATIHAAEHPVRLLSLKGLLCNEGWSNSVRIARNVFRRRQTLIRMAELWKHFSRNSEYFSYAVFSAIK
jgi:SAM-dependent methyltransferase